MEATCRTAARALNRNGGSSRAAGAQWRQKNDAKGVAEADGNRRVRATCVTFTNRPRQLEKAAPVSLQTASLAKIV